MTDHHGFTLLPGQPLPYGATPVPGGVNFSIAAPDAAQCVLVLFQCGEWEPFAEIPFPPECRFAGVFAMTVLGLDAASIEYGYRLYGPFSGVNDAEPPPILLDPYARAVGGREVWAADLPEDHRHTYKGQVMAASFHWGDDRPLRIPLKDLVIYELHVRGFTRHESSGVRHPGTYDGLKEKIPYLKDLGINAVELMPVWEFDEWEHWDIDPKSGQLYLQYWGYSPISFFAPKAGYAAVADSTLAANELKSLVKALHENGIEVILDVVLNHTAEGNELGPVFCFKGINPGVYYLLTPEGYYYNFSGTGNTINCNHGAVIPLILDCLRYWVLEYHIDGFRFDLASIMTRDVNGGPQADPPLLRQISADPILRDTKLIAEPWDAGGLYHVGWFPDYAGRWSEWNGQYRDTLRQFLKGDPGQVGKMAQLIQGSPYLYAQRSPTASINFVTSHDGFTLLDLCSYTQKRNDNSGGMDANYSENYGAEGPTISPRINAIRRRQVKNALAILLMSQGVPMLPMGDEVGRTQHGNNNAYRQDSEISWFDWRLLDENDDLYRFVRACIRFRQAHPALRAPYFYEKEYNALFYDLRLLLARQAELAAVDARGDAPLPHPVDLPPPPLTFHGVEQCFADFGDESRALAYMLSGESPSGERFDDPIYVAMNMGEDDLHFNLPALPAGRRWHVFASTGAVYGEIHEPGQEALLGDQEVMLLIARSIAILVGK